MKTVELPGGYTATLRDPDEMLGKGKRVMRSAILAAAALYARVPALAEGRREDESDDEYGIRVAEDIGKAHLSPTDLEALERLREASVVALFESWTHPTVPPTMETLGDLDGDTYDALLAGVGAIPKVDQVGIVSSDPNSPTNDSGSSNSGTEADPESPQTQTSSADGTPTSGESPSQEQ